MLAKLRSKKRYDGKTIELVQGVDESSTVFSTASSGQTSLLPGRPGSWDLLEQRVLNYRARLSRHRMNCLLHQMELDLRSLFGLHVHSCSHCLRPRNSLPSPRFWAHKRGRYWSAKIDDTLCNPLPPVSMLSLFLCFLCRRSSLLTGEGGGGGEGAKSYDSVRAWSFLNLEMWHLETA